MRDEPGYKQCLRCEQGLPSVSYKNDRKPGTGFSHVQYCMRPDEARAWCIFKDAILLRRHGIGEAQYDEMLAEQVGGALNADLPSTNRASPTCRSITAIPLSDQKQEQRLLRTRTFVSSVQRRPRPACRQHSDHEEPNRLLEASIL